MERICGFLVVRKPNHASNERLSPNLRLGDKVYRGIDRLRWEDFDSAHYDGRLPSSLRSIWQELDQDSNDFSGVPLLKDYQKAKKVLKFSGPWSEIIAIWSPELDRVKGSLVCDIELRYLGMDCFCLGEWSILLSGAYERPELFSETTTRLNEYGLLNDEADCLLAFERYSHLADSEMVEPLAIGSKATNVRVYDPVEPKNNDDRFA